MKCPKCDLVTSNSHDICPRCKLDLNLQKRNMGISPKGDAARPGSRFSWFHKLVGKRQEAAENPEAENTTSDSQQELDAVEDRHISSSQNAVIDQLLGDSNLQDKTLYGDSGLESDILSGDSLTPNTELDAESDEVPSSAAGQRVPTEEESAIVDEIDGSIGELLSLIEDRKDTPISALEESEHSAIEQIDPQSGLAEISLSEQSPESQIMPQAEAETVSHPQADKTVSWTAGIDHEQIRDYLDQDQSTPVEQSSPAEQYALSIESAMREAADATEQLAVSSQAEEVDDSEDDLLSRLLSSTVENLESETEGDSAAETAADQLHKTPEVAPSVMEFSDVDEFLEEQLDQMIGDMRLDVEAVATETPSAVAHQEIDTSFLVDDDLEISFEVEVEDDENSEELDIAADDIAAVDEPYADPEPTEEELLMDGLLDSFNEIDQTSKWQSIAHSANDADSEPAPNETRKVEATRIMSAVDLESELGADLAALTKTAIQKSGDTSLEHQLDAEIALLAQDGGTFLNSEPEDSGDFAALERELESEIASLAEQGMTFLESETHFALPEEENEPDQFSQMESELDAELAMLAGDGMTFLGANDAESPDSLLEQDEASEAAEPDSNPYAALESELEDAIAELASGGTTFGSLSSNLEVDEAASAEEQTAPAESAAEDNQAAQEMQELQDEMNALQAEEAVEEAQDQIPAAALENEDIQVAQEMQELQDEMNALQAEEAEEEAQDQIPAAALENEDIQVAQEMQELQDEMNALQAEEAEEEAQDQIPAAALENEDIQVAQEMQELQDEMNALQAEEARETSQDQQEVSCLETEDIQVDQEMQDLLDEMNALEAEEGQETLQSQDAVTTLETGDSPAAQEMQALLDEMDALQDEGDRAALETQDAITTLETEDIPVAQEMQELLDAMNALEAESSPETLQNQDAIDGLEKDLSEIPKIEKTPPKILSGASETGIFLQDDLNKIISTESASSQALEDAGAYSDDGSDLEVKNIRPISTDLPEPISSATETGIFLQGDLESILAESEDDLETERESSNILAEASEPLDKMVQTGVFLQSDFDNITEESDSADSAGSSPLMQSEAPQPLDKAVMTGVFLQSDLLNALAEEEEEEEEESKSVEAQEAEGSCEKKNTEENYPQSTDESPSVPNSAADDISQPAGIDAESFLSGSSEVDPSIQQSLAEVMGAMAGEETGQTRQNQYISITTGAPQEAPGAETGDIENSTNTAGGEADIQAGAIDTLNQELSSLIESGLGDASHLEGEASAGDDDDSQPIWDDILGDLESAVADIDSSSDMSVVTEDSLASYLQGPTTIAPGKYVEQEQTNPDEVSLSPEQHGGKLTDEEWLSSIDSVIMSSTGAKSAPSSAALSAQAQSKTSPYPLGSVLKLPTVSDALWQDSAAELRSQMEREALEVEISVDELHEFEQSETLSLLFELTDEELSNPSRRYRYDSPMPTSAERRLESSSLEKAVKRYESDRKKYIKRKRQTARTPALESAVPVTTAGMMRRLGAAVVDFVILSAVGFFLARFQVFPTIPLTVDGLLSWEMLPHAFDIALYVYGLWFITSVLMIAGNGQSIAGNLFGIRVVNMRGMPVGFGQSLVRAMSLSTSLLTLGMGFLAGFGSGRRTLHDSLAKTQVVLAEDEFEE